MFQEFCRKLYNLSHDKTLSSSLDLRSHPLTLQNLWKVLHRRLSANTNGVHVQGLSQRTNTTMEMLTVAFMNHLCGKCPDLSSLSLERFDLRDIPLEVFPHNLKRLSLRESMLTMGWFDCLKFHFSLDLTFLDLHSCSKISNNDLESLSYLKNVKTLILCNCYRISARGIPSITANMKKLKYVDLSGCPGVNNVVLFYLSKLRLEHLGLRFCHLITSAGLNQLFLHDVGRTLKSLDLYSCHELKNDALDVIAYHTTCLRLLDVGGCDQLTLEKVDQIKIKLENCKIKFQVASNDSHTSKCKNEINYNVCSRMHDGI